MVLEFKDANYDEDPSSRLDRWLKRKFDGVTQGVLERSIRKRFIRVNGLKCEPKTNLLKNDKISIEKHLYEDFAKIKKDSLKQKKTNFVNYDFSDLIIEDNKDFFVLNKLSGIDVQGGKNISVCIDDWLKSISKEYRLVHRLDRDTSGLLIIAKNLKTTIFFAKLFKEHNIQKIYRAIVFSKPHKTEGVIKKDIINNDKALSAETNYNVIRLATEETNWSEVELTPKNGRKHQLRIHMAGLGCPIIGDKKYDVERRTFYLFKDIAQKKLFLHAYKLIFKDADNKTRKIVAPLPKYWP